MNKEERKFCDNCKFFEEIENRFVCKLLEINRYIDDEACIEWIGD